MLLCNLEEDDHDSDDIQTDESNWLPLAELLLQAGADISIKNHVNDLV